MTKRHIHDINVLFDSVYNWADSRNLIEDGDPNRQMLKVIEEIGELAGAMAKKKDYEIIDGIGDSFVTLIILSHQLGFDPDRCLNQALAEISGRTGKVVDGVFIKSKDESNS